MTLPPVLDIEVTGGLSSANLIAWMKTYLTTVKSLTGRTPIVYSYDSFIRSTLGNTTAFKGYPLWYARYTSVTPTSAMLPGGWLQWTMWQYTSTGTTPGIIGAGDVNRFNGTYASLVSFADGRKGGIAPPAAPTGVYSFDPIAGLGKTRVGGTHRHRRIAGAALSASRSTAARWRSRRTVRSSLSASQPVTTPTRSAPRTLRAPEIPATGTFTMPDVRADVGDAEHRADAQGDRAPDHLGRHVGRRRRCS